MKIEFPNTREFESSNLRIYGLPEIRNCALLTRQTITGQSGKETYAEAVLSVPADELFVSPLDPETFGVGRKTCVRRSYKVWFGHAQWQISFANCSNTLPWPVSISSWGWPMGICSWAWPMSICTWAWPMSIYPWSHEHMLMGQDH